MTRIYIPAGGPDDWRQFEKESPRRVKSLLSDYESAKGLSFRGRPARWSERNRCYPVRSGQKPGLVGTTGGFHHRAAG